MRKRIMLKLQCWFLSSMVAALAITVLFLNIVLPLVLLPSREILRNMTSYTLKGCFCFYRAQDSSISVVLIYWLIKRHFDFSVFRALQCC